MSDVESPVVLVCGGRDFSNQGEVFASLDMIHEDRRHIGIACVIQGGCTGADRLAMDWARRRGVAYRTVKADWEKHGRSAGPIRNQAMLDLRPDLVLAFPGGRGTADMVRRAREAGIETITPRNHLNEIKAMESLGTSP